MTFGEMGLAHVGPELEEVRKNILKELRLPFIDQLVKEKLFSFDSALPPALVILSARLFNYRRHPVLALACVLQFIYLATRIHFAPGERAGLPVLLGDLLYAKFFSFLCRYNCLEFLAPLAEVISRIHEGGALREDGKSRTYPECLRMVELESACLLREACRAGAKVGGATPERVEQVGEFGLNLGCALGLLREKAPAYAWSGFLGIAREKLAFLPARPEREALGLLVDAVTALGRETGEVMAG